MWRDNTLHLPEIFWKSYSKILTNLGALDDCKNGTTKKDIHGGASFELTKEHFTYRFANSASRTCYIILDPLDRIPDICENVISSFLSHDIYVLDLAGGTGAGTVGFLTAMCKLREAGVLPYSPLNFHIFAADYSAHALEIYEQMIREIHEYCVRCGINVTFNSQHWDATDPSSTNLLCNHWLSIAATNEVFVLVNNLSGVGKTIFDQFQRSLQHVTDRISHLPSTFLWVEPPGSSSQTILERAQKLIFNLTTHFTASTVPKDEFNFEWRHELQRDKKLLSGGIRLMRYQRSKA